MAKTIRWTILWVFLVAVVALVGPLQQEALAVGPCGTICTTDNCFSQKCACETPEWGIKVTTCANCPWVPGNPCSFSAVQAAPGLQDAALSTPSVGCETPEGSLAQQPVGQSDPCEADCLADYQRCLVVCSKNPCFVSCETVLEICLGSCNS